MPFPGPFHLHRPAWRGPWAPITSTHCPSTCCTARGHRRIRFPKCFPHSALAANPPSQPHQFLSLRFVCSILPAMWQPAGSLPPSRELLTLRALLLLCSVHLAPRGAPGQPAPGIHAASGCELCWAAPRPILTMHALRCLHGPTIVRPRLSLRAPTTQLLPCTTFTRLQLCADPTQPAPVNVLTCSAPCMSKTLHSLAEQQMPLPACCSRL